MPLPNWHQIKEIFLDAIELAPDERARFLDEKCGADSELRGEVEKLIAQDEEAEDLMSRPLMDDSGIHVFARMIDEEDPLVGRIVGAYRLEKQIGRGGMGAVYLAERADGSFRQQVAVKLIKRGMDTDFILRRFRQERQILASLNHPLIARLLDGGTTEDNLPYFVMEFIAGKPLYKFSDEKKLTIADRLKLFRQICEAIDYAHQNRVIHRDIKPPNILVTESGTPKLLDFGIAKVLNPDLSLDTIDPTATAMRLMTPEYASPEQVCGLPVTPASDIYSLGVLLYELLTGHRPYRFQNRAPHEIARVICEEEPDRPSTGVTREDNLLPTGASEATTLVDVYLLRGAANIGDLQKQLAGNLERIILKCLRKEPSERYQTAHALVEDISRYLTGKPVIAESRYPVTRDTKPESPHVKSLAVLPLKILNLAAKTDSDENFLSVGLADALISRLSGIKALAVRPTSAVLRYGGENIDPLQAGTELDVDLILDGRLKVAKERIRVSLQLLDVKTATSVWANQFDENFADALELEDKISEKISEVLLPELTITEKKQIKKQGTDNPEAFDAYLRGRFFWNKFTPEYLPKAFEAFQRAIELDSEYAMAYASLADFYNWAGIYGVITSIESHAKAKEFALRALEIDDELAEALAAYALAISSGDWNRAEAERLYQKAIELHPNYSLAHEWYAALMVGEGRFEEGVKMVRKAEKLNPLSLRAMTLSAWTFYQAGLFLEAIAKAEQIINLDKNFPQGYVQLGNALMHVGRTGEAVAAAEQADKLMPNTALPKYLLCHTLVADNRREEARKVLEELETLAARTYVKPFFLGLSYAALGERDKAFEFFGKAFDEGDEWMNWFGTDAKLEPLRRDPRFHEIFRRTNNPLAGAEMPATEAAPHENKSLAVLPFTLFGGANSNDTGDDYLSLGLADAIITRLSNVRRLVVRPTSSILRFQKTATDPFQAGRELGAAYVLTGTIRRVGERLRVTIQLLSTTENATIRAEKFDENLTDVLELEDLISGRVAKSLIPELTGEEKERLQKRGTNSPAAYESFMRGRYLGNQFTGDAMNKALAAYNEAVQLDPDYALPHVGIAESYVWTAIFGALPCREAYPKAKEEIRKALAIDDTLAEGYALSAFVTMLYDWDWANAERLVRKALELNPNYHFAHNAYAHILASQGVEAEALEEINLAEKLDPLSPLAKIMTSCISYQTQHFGEGAAKARQASSMLEDVSQSFLHLGNSLMHNGETREAVDRLKTSSQLMGNSALPKFMLCFALVADGQRGEAEKVLAGILETAAEEFVKPYFVAMAYAALGKTDESFEWFAKSVEARDEWLIWFGTDIKLDVLRGDARYFQILKQTNNPIIKRQPPPAEKAGENNLHEKSIAVLPLKFFGEANENTGDSYLQIGLADALVTRLSNVRRFIVRPTSSVLQYNKAEINPLAAGRELGVDFVIEGNILRAGERIRVRVQLLDVGESSTVWAQNFDEDFTDVLSLEDSISEQIAKSLLPYLTGEDERRLKKRGTDNATAFEAYLRGRHHWNTFTEEGFAKALIFYNQAIAAAPDYALAYAGIADYYNFLGIYAIMPMTETSSAAKEAALDAIAADPNLAEGYSALGFAVLMHDFDWTQTEKHLRRGVELNPNYVTGRVWYGYFLGLCGRWDEGLAQIEHALKIDRLTPIVPQTYNWILYYSRRYDEAIEMTRRFIKDEPRYGLTFLFFGSLLWRAGHYDEALKICLRAVELLGRTPYTLVWLASAHAAKGETAEAEKIIAEIEDLSTRRYCSPYLLAMVYANLKNEEKTFELLEKAWEIRDGRLLWLGVDPQFDAFRGNPRLARLLRLTNNPALDRQPLPPKENSEKTLAVLPFKIVGANFTANTGDDYLGIGLADALITRLSKVRRLVVRPTNSVLGFQANDTNALAAGKSLEVEYLLDGTIRRTSRGFRATAQLLNIGRNATHWSEQFNVDFTDVIELEDSISKQVAEAVIPQLTGEEQKKLTQRATDNKAAYEAYLRGRYHFNTFTEVGFKKSIEAYNEAINLDPKYALAFAGIADYYNWLGVYGVMDAYESFQLAKQAALKAIELEPELSEAHASLGFASVGGDYNWKWGEESCRRALKLNPNNATAHVWFSIQLFMEARFEEGEYHARRAIELDPLAAFNSYNLGWCLYYARKYDESAAQQQKTIADHPLYAISYYGLAWTLRMNEQHEDAVAAARRALELSDKAFFWQACLAQTLAAAGFRAEAEEILAKLLRESETQYISPYHVALIYHFLGKREKTFEFLERSLETKEAWIVWSGVEPAFDEYRADERFQKIQQAINYPLHNAETRTK